MKNKFTRAWTAVAAVAGLVFGPDLLGFVSEPGLVQDALVQLGAAAVAVWVAFTGDKEDA